MNSDEGWVRLWRMIENDPIWTELSPVTLKVWIHCLLAAAWEPKASYDGHQEIVIPSGSFLTNVRTLAEDCRVTTSQVRTALDHLARVESLRTQRVRTAGRAHEGTLISVLNYSRYQPVAPDDDNRSARENALNVATEGACLSIRERARYGNCDGIESQPSKGQPSQPNRNRIATESGKSSLSAPNPLKNNDRRKLYRTPLKEEEFKNLRNNPSLPSPRTESVAQFQELVDKYQDLLAAYPNPTEVDEGCRMWISLVSNGEITAENLPEVFEGLERWKVSEQWLAKRMIHSVRRWLQERRWKDHPKPAANGWEDL